jgi:predicted HTH transcriptional regulator
LPITKAVSSGVEPRKVEGRGSGRQEKILEILKEKGKAQVWELKQIFPEVSKRTLRRDFEQMLNQDLIERMGERNETFYQIKGDRS